MALGWDILYAVLLLLGSPYWVWRLTQGSRWRTDWAGRLGRVHLEPGTRKTLLIHAVSVGEVNAIRILVEEFQRRHGQQVRVVISVTTDTGIARARSLFGATCSVVRYPFDFSFAVRRFLRAVQPDAVALVELEVWPNFVGACTRRRIPVAVLNGRLSDRSHRRYRKLKWLLYRTFRSLESVDAQNEDYAKRFVEMGVQGSSVTVSSSMKWDTAQIADDVPGAQDLALAMGINPEKKLIVAGSTGPGEEHLLVSALRDVDAQLLIAPRKPERFDEAAAVMTHPVRRSAHPDGTPRPVDGRMHFLLDTIGDLRKAYALADAVVVGRSFCPLFGSDMMEPVALGKPTLVGPNVADFKDIVQKLLEGGGILQLSGPEQIAEGVQKLLDPATAGELAARGRAVVRSQQGATERHLNRLEALLGVTGT